MARLAYSLCVLTIMLFTAQTSGLAAENRVPLALKFAPGESMEYEVSFSGGGGLKASGEEVVAVGLQGSLLVAQKVVEVLPDGSGRLETRIPRANAEITFGEKSARLSFADGNLRFFAEGEESPPIDSADLRALPLLVAPVVLTVAPNGQTTDFSLADPQLLQELGQATPDLDLQQFSSSRLPLFPDSPVGVGETWRRSLVFSPLGPALPIVVNMSRTLDSFQEQAGIGVAKISGFSSARVNGGQALTVPGGLSVAMPQMAETITSTEFFNTTKGQLIRGDYDLGFSSTFSVKAADTEKSASLEARMRVSVQAR